MIPAAVCSHYVWTPRVEVSSGTKLGRDLNARHCRLVSLLLFRCTFGWLHLRRLTLALRSIFCCLFEWKALNWSRKWCTCHFWGCCLSSCQQPSCCKIRVTNLEISPPPETTPYVLIPPVHYVNLLELRPNRRLFTSSPKTLSTDS